MPLARIPWLEYSQIKERALAFLNSCQPHCKIPLPIEDILDVRLGINIIPVPGLYEFSVAAYTWSDLKSIAVDDYLYRNPGRKYRFTLAHELGHIQLHGDFLRSFSASSVTEYLKSINSIEPGMYSSAEWQADCFAGLILVPADALRGKLVEAEQVAQKNRLNIENLATRAYMADWISDHFDVSRQTVEARLYYEGIWDRPKK